MAERPFKLAGDQFMFAVIVAVADRAEPGQVDPRPHDMTMLAVMALAVFLLMHHHNAGLAGQAQLALKPVNRLHALRVV